MKELHYFANHKGGWQRLVLRTARDLAAAQPAYD
jgi:hypothetical protein